MSTSRTRYGLALASAATLATLSCGALVGAASADPGAAPHQGGDKGKHLGQVKQEDKPDKQDKPDKGKPDKQDKPDKGKDNNGHDNAPGQNKDKDKGPKGPKGPKEPKGPKGPQGDHGNNGNGNGNGNGNSGNAGEHGDPPGNNGTVKIAAPGDEVGHPSNNPHPGCTVVVEWFGFDAGDDVVSTVTFSPQAPTKDVTIGGTSPSSVFVGGDAASGGTDLDGRQAYTLTFEGEPHPKQGYHVKLVVSTPHSLGNDTKSKVFWVEPCETTSADDETVQPDESGETGETGESDEQGGTGGSSTSDETDTDQGVLGTSAEAESDATGVAAEDADAAVPTSVDAGEDGSMLGDWARSPWPLVAVAGGLTLAGVAIARRSSRNGA